MTAENANESIEQPTPSHEPDTSAPKGVDDIADALASDMPDVQQHAIDAHQSEQTKIRSASPGFDANVHAVNKDGSPKLKADGSFALKRGRKAGAVVSTVSGVPANKEQIDQIAQARASGIAMAHIGVGICVQLFGDEWQPQKNKDFDELAQLEKASGDYCVAKGVKDIPPGAALAIAFAGYGLRRMMMPVTKSKMQKAKEWLYTKYALWKARKEPQRPVEDKKQV